VAPMARYAASCECCAAWPLSLQEGFFPNVHEARRSELLYCFRLRGGIVRPLSQPPKATGVPGRASVANRWNH
jgi:hypothetical protein